jgi:hypothetical protein
MLTVTITSTEGATITTNNLAILSGATRRMLEPMTTREVAKHATLIRELNAGAYHAAGQVANELFLTLYVAQPAPEAEYLVPVDPAEATRCEACE